MKERVQQEVDSGNGYLGDVFKREEFLAVGKHRVRVPADFHYALTSFCRARRYSRSFDGLLYAATVGLRLLAMISAVDEIKVEQSYEHTNGNGLRD